MKSNVTITDITASIKTAIADKENQISELKTALNALTDRSVTDAEVRRPRGRRSAQSDTFIVTTSKRGPGRPKGSKNRADVVAD